MQPKKDLAIVLRSIPFEERHRIVTALTEQHGQITALAKNSIQSRRFGGSLEPFVASEWLMTERSGADMFNLQEAIVRRSYEGLRKDFERLSMASAFNEVMIRIAPKHEPCPDLFRLHANALSLLEEAQTPGADLTLLNGYLAKTLQWSGSQPQLFACLRCQVPVDDVDPAVSLNCVVAEAGWVCGNCRTQDTRHIRERQGGAFEHSLLRVTQRAIVDFHNCLGLPIRKIPAAMQASRTEHQTLFKFLEALIVFHLPGFDKQPLKSLRFLDLESSVRPQAAHPRQSPPHPV
jgi:DNA repair protein RecO